MRPKHGGELATVGLQGIWPLEQLDRTGIGSWNLGLIVAGVAAVVGYLLWTVVGSMEPSPLFETDAGTDLVSYPRFTSHQNRFSPAE